MKYLGGKARIAKELTQAILENTPHREQVWEPFVGGGGMSNILAPHFNNVIYSDIDEGLILLWQHIQNNVNNGKPVPEGFPENVSEELYHQLRKQPEMTATKYLVGISASFGGKYYGGYARGKTNKGEPRNYHQETIRNLTRAAPNMFHTPNTTVLHQPYYETPAGLQSGAVIYCDPPYQGTTTYRTGEFDSDTFWEWAHHKANEGHPVFVSEYNAPDTVRMIWEKEIPVSVKRVQASKGEKRHTGHEKLFFIPPAV